MSVKVRGGGAKDVRGMYFWTADIRQSTKYVVDIVSKPNPRIVNPFIQKESIISHEINLSLLYKQRSGDA